MDPNGAGRGHESHEDRAEREEDDPGQTAENGVGDSDRIIVGRLLAGVLGEGLVC